MARFGIKRSQDLENECTVEESMRYRSVEWNHQGGQGTQGAVAPKKKEESECQCKQYCYCMGAIWIN